MRQACNYVPIHRGVVMGAEVMTQRVVITPQELEICLEKALKEIITMMFNRDMEIMPADHIEVVPPGLSAIVGFGGRISGYVAIHLSPASACTLASNLLGMSISEVDDIVADAMGEMANMLAGGLKKFACQTEDLFKISVPSIVYGTDYATHAPKNAERLAIGVKTCSCSFGVQLVFAAR